MSSNYITIQDFMLKDLKLKSNDLLVYAVIFGFTQDETSEYYGGRKWLSELLNLSLKTIDLTLKKLVENEFIEKVERSANNIKFYTYKINSKKLKNNEMEEEVEGSVKSSLGVVKMTTTPSKNYSRGSVKITPNNKYININKNKKESNTKVLLKKKYFENEELNKTFIEFLEIRKKLKAINSDIAITKLINFLNNKTSSDKERILMIEKSIMNSWKGLFELKKEQIKKEPKEEEIYFN
jgi:hypothetical protein